MADDYITGSNGEEDAYPIRATGLNRQQAKVRKQVKELKDSCTGLQNDEEAVSCLRETKRYEDNMSEIFRSDRKNRRMEQVAADKEVSFLP